MFRIFMFMLFLIQEIKDLLSSRNFIIYHCLHEGNQCAEFMAKLGVNSNEDLSTHATSPSDLLPLIRSDVMGTIFPRAYAFFFCLLFLLFSFLFPFFSFATKKKNYLFQHFWVGLFLSKIPLIFFNTH